MYLMHLHINVALFSAVLSSPRLGSPLPRQLPRRKSLPASNMNSIFYYSAVLWSPVYGSSLPGSPLPLRFFCWFSVVFIAQATGARLAHPPLAPSSIRRGTVHDYTCSITVWPCVRRKLNEKGMQLPVDECASVRESRLY